MGTSLTRNMISYNTKHYALKHNLLILSPILGINFESTPLIEVILTKINKNSVFEIC